MNSLSTTVNSLEWRRSKVVELSSQGYNQSEISRILQISQPTINRDISYLRRQSRNKLKRYVDERLPEEYEKCLIGITAILKEAWTTCYKTEDKREKIQALSLAKECYSTKLDLLTNATVVEDVIRFISLQEKEKAKANTSILTQDNTNDIQGTGQEDKQKPTTTNTVF